MPNISLKTKVRADIMIVFNLSRSIDLHKISTKHTNETAIAGTTFGLISLNETVTWRAKHLGFYQKMTSKITQFQMPMYFIDEMVKGPFQSFRHEHHFSEANGITSMVDKVEYKSPFGTFGKLADMLFLKTYLVKLLEKRNQVIKEFAETEKWKDVPEIETASK